MPKKLDDGYSGSGPKAEDFGQFRVDDYDLAEQCIRALIFSGYTVTAKDLRPTGDVLIMYRFSENDI